LNASQKTGFRLFAYILISFLNACGGGGMIVAGGTTTQNGTGPVFSGGTTPASIGSTVSGLPSLTGNTLAAGSGTNGSATAADLAAINAANAEATANAPSLAFQPSSALSQQAQALAAAIQNPSGVDSATLAQQKAQYAQELIQEYAAQETPNMPGAGHNLLGRWLGTQCGKIAQNHFTVYFNAQGGISTYGFPGDSLTGTVTVQANGDGKFAGNTIASKSQTWSGPLNQDNGAGSGTLVPNDKSCTSEAVTLNKGTSMNPDPVRMKTLIQLHAQLLSRVLALLSPALNGLFTSTDPNVQKVALQIVNGN
jgi:hypothetical protein